MRLLGIDAGEKRVGLALSDRLNKAASPLKTLDNDKDLKENLLKVIKKYEIRKVVVGMPYNLKGEKGYQAKRVEDFIEENLKNTAADDNIEIIKIDERFSSIISERIISGKTARKNNKYSRSNLKGSGRHRPLHDNDSISAAILLSDYIEREKTVERN